MARIPYSPSRHTGYTLIEMMFVVGLVTLLSSMALVQAGASKAGLKGDGAMRTVLGQLTQARENAISQRRYVRVVLTAPNLIKIVREDTTTTTTTLSSVSTEGGVQFTRASGLPDTPDGLLLGQTGAIAFGSVTNVKFAPDGTLVNQDGASANGTAFLAIPNQPLSARAVTIFGSTGRIRGFKWDGLHWIRA